MAQQPINQREKLDVESPQAREARLGHLLSSISPSSSDKPSGSAPTSPINPLPSWPSALPESDAVLARVRAFLPQFQAANAQLLAKAADDPESVNIEKVNGDRAIAMDLGLGVFDAPRDSTSNLGPVVDSQIPEGLSEEHKSESEEDSSEESSSDSDSDSESDEARTSGLQQAPAMSESKQDNQAVL
ncbi:hypothetical protein I316_05339 [Kwoniella heveanensis BCC8398]|uniref:Uncharacterized protein n=1 Tax=Kwoniella heveanensis BCC8398 TaxID=1296120 RepID=A0A1B9GPR9_9TREE|nr:hypothetical protein I316_05339 [Kwoniella heveanensis BCC8398]